MDKIFSNKNFSITDRIIVIWNNLQGFQLAQFIYKYNKKYELFKRLEKIIAPIKL